jgi:hypothetical protein
MNNIQNAIIESTSLGFEDHGIFTCFLYLKLEVGSQGFGGYGLDEWVGERSADGKRVDKTGVGLEFIRAIMETVGVEKWEDLKGKHIRIIKAPQWNSQIEGIGNFLEDKWFEPKKWFKEEYNIGD